MVRTLALFNHKSQKITEDDYLELDLLDLERFLDYEEIKDFSKIPSKSIENKTILEWFKIDNISTWWLISQMIYPKYQEAILFIQRLNKCLDHFSPEKLEIHGCIDKIHLIKQICEKRNIQLYFLKSELFFSNIQEVKIYLKKVLYDQITKNKLKKRLSLYKKKSIQIPKKDFILFTAPGIYNREIFDLESKISKNQEFILQPIFNQLKNKNMSYYCIDLDYTLQGDTIPLSKRIQSDDNWFPLESILVSNYINVSSKINFLKKEIKKMLNSMEDDFFSFMDTNFTSFMKNMFNEIFLAPNLPMYLKLIYAIEQFFQKHRPDVIIQVYETGPYAKVFEFVAKKLGIKTIGIQHGIIYDNNPDYFHKEVHSDKFSLGNPLPNFTWVFGQYYKNILINNGCYSSNSVVVIGNPSFYQLEQIKKTLDRESLLSTYNIENKKTLLLPLSFRLSQLQNNSDRLLLEYLNKNLENRNDISVIVRPHPGDVESLNIKLQEFSSKCFIESKKSLIEDIFISDAVVTVTSTVGFDSVFFAKPVFYVDLGGSSQNSLGGIRKQLFNTKLAFLVPIENLVSEVDKLNYKDWINETTEQRKSFLKEHSNYYEECDFLKLIFKN